MCVPLCLPQSKIILTMNHNAPRQHGCLQLRRYWWLSQAATNTENHMRTYMYMIVQVFSRAYGGSVEHVVGLVEYTAIRRH